jgi:putative drug exporter of the RND superfamily
MGTGSLRQFVCRRSGWVVVAWLAAALVVGLTAPDLTRTVAESQTRLLPDDAESVRASALVREAWPGRSASATVVVALHRPDGLTEADRAYARDLVGRFQSGGRPRALLHVLGPHDRPEVADRLVSSDGTVQLLVTGLDTAFLSPASGRAIQWLQDRARESVPPTGLRVLWSGDAVLGRDFMGCIRQSLDRAAGCTIVLLLGVLLVVYRSVWLALVPMVTIGVGLVVARGLLAWMMQAGWASSPLVELFLIVILFGCGTDFCLFLSWRFAEHWDEDAPSRAMAFALGRAKEPLLTSAGTVIAGLSLMGLTRFKLFSSTGPSVAIGLALTLAAALTLTPALLLILARTRPGSFAGLTSPSSGFWAGVARRVMARPLLVWTLILAVLAVPAAYGMRVGVIHDLLAELPARTASVRDLKFIAEKFGPGTVAPLAVVIESDQDLRQSPGLALIDDVSRILARQPGIAEVRSATQPLGSTAPFDPARLSARLSEVHAGLGLIAEGNETMRDRFEQRSKDLSALLAWEKLVTPRLPSWVRSSGARPSAEAAGAPDLRERMLDELKLAAEKSEEIARGARRGRVALAAVFDDPVGRRRLDTLMVTEDIVRKHPAIGESFAAYLSDDGRRARIDLSQRDRLFSSEASGEVERLRRLLNAGLAGNGWLNVRAYVTGINAEWADIRATTRRDQVLLWTAVPIGVFLILVVAIRNVWSSLNLVATMILTYAFSLGATHALFVSVLGAEGLDWTVPYFLFVLLVAVGVDYNVFLMSRLREEQREHGLVDGSRRAIARTGGLISSAAAITACSFASFLSSPLASIRQLGFALVVGLTVDALFVRPVLVPCGNLLLSRLHRHAKPPEELVPD